MKSLLWVFTMTLMVTIGQSQIQLFVNNNNQVKEISVSLELSMDELYSMILELHGYQQDIKDVSIIREDTNLPIDPEDMRDLADAGIHPLVTLFLIKIESQNETTQPPQQIQLNTFGLDIEEFRSIRSYTDIRHENINGALRANCGKINEIKDKTIQNQAKLIHDGINKLIASDKNFRGTVFRGQKMKMNKYQELRKGQIFEFNCFVSTSTDLDIAFKFCRQGMGNISDPDRRYKWVIFEINVFQGANLRGIAVINENEILLQNDKFQIEKLTTIHHDGIQYPLIVLNQIDTYFV